MDEWDKVNYLRELKFIGYFPLGIEVLLVPLNTAVEEIKFIEEDITSSRLLKLLKDQDVHIFNSPEDWLKYKNPDLWRKKTRSRVRQ